MLKMYISVLIKTNTKTFLIHTKFLQNLYTKYKSKTNITVTKYITYQVYKRYQVYNIPGRDNQPKSKNSYENKYSCKFEQKISVSSPLFAGGGGGAEKFSMLAKRGDLHFFNFKGGVVSKNWGMKFFRWGGGHIHNVLYLLTIFKCLQLIN